MSEEIRQARYRVKLRQSLRQAHCPCGDRWPHPTDLHHLFTRRGPDHEALYHPVNVILMHNACNTNERWRTQVNAALMKLWQFGPDVIEAWVESLPLSTPTLPSHYWRAKELYERGVMPFAFERFVE